jgi:hypothetical protein
VNQATQDEDQAAYQEYIDNQYDEMFSHSVFSNLKEDAIERIRRQTLSFSEGYVVLVRSELAKAKLLLDGKNPDLSAAFFHAYRGMDGYLANVIDYPIASVLIEPIAALFVTEKVASHQKTIVKALASPIRTALLKTLCTGEEESVELEKRMRQVAAFTELRNSVAHRFTEPTRKDVLDCIAAVSGAVELIENERQKARANRP